MADIPWFVWAVILYGIYEIVWLILKHREKIERIKRGAIEEKKKEDE